MATDLSEEQQNDVEVSQESSDSQETSEASSSKKKIDFSNKKLKTIALLILVMLVEAAGIEYVDRLMKAMINQIVKFSNAGAGEVLTPPAFSASSLNAPPPRCTPSTRPVPNWGPAPE